MNILLVGLNARYVHTNLAIRLLRDAIGEEASFYEATINTPLETILRNIVMARPDVVGFSTYIWNRRLVMDIGSRLKTLRPEVKIILGGPEVSYDVEQVWKEAWWCDGIVPGPGEKIWQAFVRALRENESFQVQGLLLPGEVYWENREGPSTMPRQAFPYRGENLQERMIYLEASRGCPFRCRFCLSSREEGLQFLGLQEAKEQFLQALKTGARVIKYVDRTANAREEEFLQFLEFINDVSPEKTQVHFEVTGRLLSFRALEVLNALRAGLVQMEFGVQTTTPSVLAAIDRPREWSALQGVLQALGEGRRVKRIVDLIAGLPYETFESFQRSFDEVYPLADVVQLGFLKVLPGSPMEEDARTYGMRYAPTTPYEILETPWMSAEEIYRLKDVEHAVESFSIFPKTLQLLLEEERPFSLFDGLGQSLYNSGEGGKSVDDLGEILLSHGEKIGVDLSRLYDSVVVDLLPRKQYIRPHPLFDTPPLPLPKEEAFRVVGALRREGVFGENPPPVKQLMKGLRMYRHRAQDLVSLSILCKDKRETITRRYPHG